MLRISSSTLFSVNILTIVQLISSINVSIILLLLLLYINIIIFIFNICIIIIMLLNLVFNKQLQIKFFSTYKTC